MNDKTLEQQLKEINRNIVHNMRFLLESYSEEVLEIIDEHVLALERKNKEPFEQIRKEVRAVIRTLKSIDTVINHHTDENL
jgi:hypothetical protein